MTETLVIVGAWFLFLAVSGWAIERRPTVFQRMSDEVFGDEQE